MSLWKPSIREVVHLHEKLINRTGGADGVRSIPLIQSALQRFDAAYEEQDVYSALYEKTAAVCCGLVQNYGFIDGNKRVGVETMRFILVMNNIQLRYTQDELVTLGMLIAQGKLNVPDVAAWIEARIH